MLKWPFKGLRDLQPGNQKVTLNHLECYTFVQLNFYKTKVGSLTSHLELDHFGSDVFCYSLHMFFNQTNPASKHFAQPDLALGGFLSCLLKKLPICVDVFVCIFCVKMFDDMWMFLVSQHWHKSWVLFSFFFHGANLAMWIFWQIGTSPH